MLRVIKPNKLRKGDTIGIIAPGGPVNAKRLKLGVQYIRNAGFSVKLGENIFKKFGYLAGRDSERVQDLHSMLIDLEVNAIFVARGGYGSLRLLPSLDYELVRTHPKIIVGYSDITALQWAILSHTGLVTFSGPMARLIFEQTRLMRTQHHISGRY